MVVQWQNGATCCCVPPAAAIILYVFSAGMLPCVCVCVCICMSVCAGFKSNNGIRTHDPRTRRQKVVERNKHKPGLKLH